LKTIKKADLAEPVRVSEKSLMPEGLGYNMSAQDFRDLVRYLMANPFITYASAGTQALSVGVPGRLVLPDTKAEPVLVRASVEAPVTMKTKVLIGSTGDYEVRLNGRVLGSGKGAGKELRPDRDSFDVTLQPGVQSLEIVVKGPGGPHAVFARFLDPDRKLKYPEPSEKK
jgi:hypothetical protein